MDNFDKTFQKAKDIFNVARKKTGDVVSIQKQKLDLSSLNNKLEKAYAVLGEIYFAEVKDETLSDTDKASAVLDIKTLLAEIKTLKDDIDLAEGKITCKKCGCKSVANSKFCSSCGADLTLQK